MKRREILGGGAAVFAGMTGPAWAQETRPEPWTTLRATAPLPNPVETGHFKSGDAALYYAVYGKGAPVVFLHPGLGHSDYWANQIGPFAQTHQVVVTDLRGHGRSTASAQPLSYRLLAEDLLALTRKLNLKKPSVVGWGDGAVAGLEFAMRHPKRIGQLAAFGLTYDVAGQQPAPDRSATFVEYVHKAAADYRRLSPEPQKFDQLFGQLEALWAAEPHYTPDQLARVKTPTAILAAAYDEWVKPEHMEEAARLIPAAQLVFLNDVSHFAPWQASKRFNDVLRLLL